MRSEKLSQQLGEMDNDLLDKAWEIDNEQKLNAYTGKTQRKVFRPKIAALAASVALVLLVSAVSLPWLGNHTAGLGSQEDPAVDPTWASRPGDPVVPVVPGQPNDKPLQKPQIGDIKNVQINSVDKLNYYAAMQLLADASKLSAQSQNGIKAVPLLDLVGTDGIPYEQDVPETTEGPPVTNPTQPPHSTTPPDEKIYYYEVDPTTRFFISEVVFFQIELTDANGFLASKVGTGLVDVVITNNGLEPMITFRNGDRFFSCLENGGNQLTIWRFSTHKYIQGFNIVKNLEQENCGFYVSFDGDRQATCFECMPFVDNGSNRPDQNVRIASTTTVSNTGGTFTIAELEAIFNQEKGI